MSSASAFTRATHSVATELGRALRERGAWVVDRGRDSRDALPEEAATQEGAHAVVRGDGDSIGGVLSKIVSRDDRCPSTTAGASRATTSYRRMDLLPGAALYVGLKCRRFAGAPSTAHSVPCGEPTARSPGNAQRIGVVREIVELRRLGFRFIALADDNSIR